MGRVRGRRHRGEGNTKVELIQTYYEGGLICFKSSGGMKLRTGIRGGMMTQN